MVTEDQMMDELELKGIDYDTRAAIAEDIADIVNKHLREAYEQYKKKSDEKSLQLIAVDAQCVNLTNENIILGLAFGKACETIISQYIDDEPYMDVIEEWKDESMIEEPGVSNEMLEQYFFEQAQKEVNKDEA